MEPTALRPARRVIAGTDESGASAVVSDENAPATILPNGIVLQELWQQRSLPARTTDQPMPEWTLGPDAPAVGAVVRILTVPAGDRDHPAPPEFHSDPSLHVITMLDGELEIVLEGGTVTLAKGQSIVLRDSMHDLRNRAADPAQFVYTSFPLIA